MQSEIDHSNKAHELEVQRLKEEKIKSDAEWEKKLKEYESHLGEKNRDLERANAKRIEDLENLYKQRIKEINDKHSKEMVELEANLKAEMESALKDAENREAQKIDKLNRQNEEKLQQFSKEFDIILAQKSKEYEKQIEDLQRSIIKLKEENSLKESSLTGQINDLISEVSKLKDQVQQKSQESEALRQLLSNKDKEIKLLESQMITMRQDHQAAMDSKQREFEKKELELRNKFKSDKEALLKEHLEETTKLQQEFQSTVDMMEERYKQLQVRHEELQEMYDNRPSREEDLELIKHLQSELTTKEEALRKAYEDMKFYKLELINREENYNKVFGATPNVGFLNPIKKKETKTQGQRGGSGGTNTENLRKGSKLA